MNTKPHFHRPLQSHLLVLLSIILVVTSTSAHADPVKGFIRTLGSYDLDGAGSKLEISRTARGQLTTTAAWLHVGQPSCQTGPPTNTATWFVYVENPEMIWLSNGIYFMAFMHDAYGCGAGIVTADLFETCPQEVRDALPEEVRSKIITNAVAPLVIEMPGDDGQVGVGIRLPKEIGQESPKIPAVIRASPAAKAGLEPGFVLLSVDGTLTAGLSPRDCSRLMRGISGTKVTVEVMDPRLNQIKKLTLERRKSIGE
jgi:hypothetical protein